MLAQRAGKAFSNGRFAVITLCRQSNAAKRSLDETKLIRLYCRHSAGWRFVPTLPVAISKVVVMKIDWKSAMNVAGKAGRPDLKFAQSADRLVLFPMPTMTAKLVTQYRRRQIVLARSLRKTLPLRPRRRAMAKLD